MIDWLPEAIRYAEIVVASYLVGLCAWGVRYSKSRVIRFRVLGLGLLGAAIGVNQIQRWSEPLPWSVYLALPGLIFASMGMWRFRSQDRRCSDRRP